MGLVRGVRVGDSVCGSGVWGWCVGLVCVGLKWESSV